MNSILLKLVNSIRTLLEKQHNETNQYYLKSNVVKRPERMDTIINIPKNRLINDFDPTKKNILIIDDSKGVISIVEDYISECNINLDDFNILTFYDTYAPFVMINTLKELESRGLTKIDYAIIDIVLPGKIKQDNSYIRLDGIDVAKILHETYDCHNLCFYTGNIVNMYVEFIKHKTDAFYDYFKRSISDFLIFKTSGSEEEVKSDFCNLLTKHKYNI